MKKLFYLLLVAVTMLSFQSCSKDNDNNSDTEWRSQNEAAFNQLATNPAYDSIGIQGLQGYIYRKVLKSAVIPTDTAITNSSVTVYYTGRLIDGTVFDTTDKTGNPYTFTLSNSAVIKGWFVALQHMTPGDKWEVWIPWQLGYQDKAQGSSIPAYSTLIFDIEVIAVKKYPK